MGILRSHSPLVEPLSLDEAFVDLTGADLPDLELPTVTAFAERLRAEVYAATGGLTASVGVASSKFLAKIASDLDKPDGLVVVPPGTEQELLRPMQVSVIPGVGPATVERLRRMGVRTVADLERLEEDELVRELGQAHGRGLYLLARARDDRAVEPERETKSVSVEGTYESDVIDRAVMAAIVTRQAGQVARRLQSSGLSGRTVTLKVRLYDFTTLTRSSTLDGPTDDAGVIVRTAKRLLTELDPVGGVRLLGVGVSGLADWVQDELFGDEAEEVAEEDDAAVLPEQRPDDYRPGMDVEHDELGRGWVWGAGRGVVTVRFETAETGPGPVRSFPVDDPALRRWEPVPEQQPETD
jgi:DNA polymerase-4